MTKRSDVWRFGVSLLWVLLVGGSCTAKNPLFGDFGAGAVSDGALVVDAGTGRDSAAWPSPELGAVDDAGPGAVDAAKSDAGAPDSGTVAGCGADDTACVQKYGDPGVCVSGHCQGCHPIETLSCNQTLLGDTTSSAATKLEFWPCTQAGPEEVYVVDVPEHMKAVVTLSNATTEHALYAFEDADSRCFDSTCLVQSFNPNPAPDRVFLDYYEGGPNRWSVVVDATGAGGAYQLSVACRPICEARGGYIDCLEKKAFGRTDGKESTSLLDTYACLGADGLTGREVVYQFSPSADGPYTIELTDLDANLDLVVLEAVVEDNGPNSAPSCDPTGTCVGASLHAGTQAETVTFTPTVGKIYFVIVDGKGGAVGNYAIRVSGPAC